MHNIKLIANTVLNINFFWQDKHVKARERMRFSKITNLSNALLYKISPNPETLFFWFLYIHNNCH